MVEVPCPGCRRPVRARDDQVGRSVRCSKCRTRFRVPVDAGPASADPPPARRRPLGRVLLPVGLLAVTAGVVAGAVALFTHLGRPDPQAEQPVAEVDAPGRPTAPAPAPGVNTPGPPTPVKTPGVDTPGSPRTPAPVGRPVTRRPSVEPLALVQSPSVVVGVDVPFAAALRVFPPAHREADPAVVYEVRPAFQGRGRRLAVGLFTPLTGAKVGGVEFDDDAPMPVYDLSADGGRFAHVAAGRLTVWQVADGTKLVDGLDIGAGVVAAYLTEPPGRAITVEAGGRVREWDLATKKPGGEFAVPVPAGGAIDGRGVALAAGRAAVVVAAGGSVYRIDLRAGVVGKRLAELPGVGRPLAVAASAGGKVGYVFQTALAVPETLVAFLRADGKHTFYLWDGGKLVSAGWCGEDVLALGSADGGLDWFDAERGGFRPLATVRAGRGRGAKHAAADSHWSLLPNPAGPGRSLLVEYAMPPQGLIDPLDTSTDKPAYSLRLDEKGLYK